MSKKNKEPAPPPAEVRAPAPAPLPPVMPPEVAGEIPLGMIRPCPFNVRKHFPEDDIAGLAESIRTEGLLARLIVRPVGLPGAAPTFAGGRWEGLSHFELADGERRYRALRVVAETREVRAVPVVVRPLTDDQVRAVMLATREQSRDLSVSELVAGYQELRAGRTDEQLAALVGKPAGHVRGVLRLGKLPAWALAAVDAGALPRATAELVARVPGEGARKKAAACVLQGCHEPEGLVGTPDRPDLTRDHFSPLSYRDTKDLIRNHFTKELKGSPFSLKVLYPVPDSSPERHIQSCEECPKRAGNDPEATAEGTRADVCLDPDCYRQKVEAFRTQEIARHADKGIEHLDTDERFAPGHAPRGYCDLATEVWQTELHVDFPIGAKRRDEKLKDLLGKAELAKYMAFAADGRPRVLVRTSEARKALQAAGVLKRAESKPKGGTVTRGVATEKGRTARLVSVEHGPTLTEIDERAAQLAAGVLREYAEGECSELDGHEDAHEDGPIRAALELGLRAVCYDLAMKRDEACAPILKRLCVRADVDDESGAGEAIDRAVSALRPSQLLGLLVELATAMELQFGSTARDTAQSLLAFAELDWQQLTEQARRELSGEPTAEEKLDKVGAEQEKPPEPDNTQQKPDTKLTKPKGAKAK